MVLTVRYLSVKICFCIPGVIGAAPYSVCRRQAVLPELPATFRRILLSVFMMDSNLFRGADEPVFMRF